MSQTNLFQFNHKPDFLKQLAPSVYNFYAKWREFIHYEDAVTTFAKKLPTDPAYEFSWGQDAIRASAMVSVARKVQAWFDNALKNDPSLTGEQVVKKIYNELLGEVLRKARFPEHSSSHISNIMSIEVNAAMADIVVSLRPYVEG